MQNPSGVFGVLLNSYVSFKISKLKIFNLRNLTYKIKNGRLLTSHRYNRLPLLCSHPGGVQQELVVQDLPGAKIGD